MIAERPARRRAQDDSWRWDLSLGPLLQMLEQALDLEPFDLRRPVRIPFQAPPRPVRDNILLGDPAGFTPMGSDGPLCIGPAGMGRYNLSAFDAAGTGEGSLVLDLPNTPSAGPPVAIQAGETWYFTTWYRDTNPNSTSNFSDAVCITFQ